MSAGIQYDFLFTQTPKGLSDEQLLRRYRAAKAAAVAIDEPIAGLLHDWFPCHLHRFEDMLEKENK